MTRMIPIVAVVDEDCFHALNDHISSVEQPTALLQAVMDRNGWTLDALVAGACLKGALMPDLVRASRTENVEELETYPQHWSVISVPDGPENAEEPTTTNRTVSTANGGEMTNQGNVG